MRQTTISSNDDSATVRNDDAVARERRQTGAPESVSPEELIERQVENARRQLDNARETLKAARRRVVQLEGALDNWERFAAELRRDPR